LHLSGSYIISLVSATPPAADQRQHPVVEPAATRAYRHVKQRLLDGVYSDGELLSEGAIANELGVSRTPVREALLQLQGERLLTLYPKRGALVTPVSAREAGEVFEARLLVERHCLLAAAAEPGLPERLAAEIVRQRDLLSQGDSSGFAAADREFHRAWVAAAGNRVLLELYDRLRDRQQRVTAMMIAADAQRPRELVDEHATILAALDGGDADAAVTALERHLEEARRRSEL
jgi:DNA-binding GntR family transcriptional regulator